MNKLLAAFTGITAHVRHGEREVEVGNSSVLTGRVQILIDKFLFLLGHLSIKGLLITAMLLMLVVLSAIGVVYSSHLSRQLFAEQAILFDRNDQIQLEWAQLLLEQSAWSSPNRIESVAGEELGMEIPKAEDIKLIY